MSIPFGADLYYWILDIAIIGLVICFVGMDKLSNPSIDSSSSGWTYFSGKYLPSAILLPVLVYWLISTILRPVVHNFVYSNVLFFQCNTRVDLGKSRNYACISRCMVRNDRSITCYGYFDILGLLLAEDSEPQSSSEWFTKTRLNISALVISNACQLYLMLTLVILLKV